VGGGGGGGDGGGEEWEGAGWSYERLLAMGEEVRLLIERR
jgi:hypothetical protein